MQETVWVGTVNYHTGETIVLFRRRERRREVAELQQIFVDGHLTGAVYIAWEYFNTHQNGDIEAVVHSAPPVGWCWCICQTIYINPWPNPIEMLWRHFRREVTHFEFFCTGWSLAQGQSSFLSPLQSALASSAFGY